MPVHDACAASRYRIENKASHTGAKSFRHERKYFFSGFAQNQATKSGPKSGNKIDPLFEMFLAFGFR
jgi:hypothetical protein